MSDPVALRRPVQDWATDFDHLSQDWADRLPEITAELRGRCPVAHTDRFHGAYLLTRYDDVVAAANDPVRFSNRITAVNENHPDKIRLEAPPITLDPPAHGPVRRALLEPFSPQAVARLEPFIGQVCGNALDALAGRNRIDAVADYARVVPTDVTARLLGLDPGQGEQFRGWVKGILSDGQTDLELAARCTREVRDFFADQLAHRRQRPGDDLVTWMTTTTVEDSEGPRPLTEREQLGALYLILVAGIDTTWSAIGASLHHLGTHPTDRRRLVEEPELMPSAIEELLRAFTPVNMGRVIEQDGDIGGCPVRAGERLLITYGAANRDPAHFDRPDEVVLDRAHNRHLAFGVGVHRCLGSNLARTELAIALRAWLERYPDFEVVDDVSWTIGVRGPRSVPVVVR